MEPAVKRTPIDDTSQFQKTDKPRLNWRLLMAFLAGIKLLAGLLWVDRQMVLQLYEFVTAFNLTTSPWTVYFQRGDLAVFPYPPLMLYLYRVVLAPVELLGLANTLWLPFFYLLPILAADLGIFYWINRLVPGKQGKIVFFYFASPVVLYAMYVLGHLDLMALFFVLTALFYLKERRYRLSAAMLALGFSFKIPVLFALPLILVFLAKNKPRRWWRETGEYIGVFGLTALAVSAPFLVTESYWRMVLLNPQQSLLYSLTVTMGDRQLYVAYLAVLVVYGRFAMYEKVNKDLFYNFLAVIYSVFVILVPPMENWYVWSYVLCAVLFVDLLDHRREAYALSSLFSLSYLAFFLGAPLLGPGRGQNLLFTTFQGVLLAIVYMLYRFGIKSNQVYRKKEQAIAIGVGGDSGVGKTTVKTSILNLLGEGNVVSIESDGDHKWERDDASWDQFTHLNPKANYLYRQAQSLKILKNGGTIDRVDYDHATGRFLPPKKVEANDFILVAGLHPFYLPQTRRLIDLKIYLDTEEKLRRHWKLLRDMAQRGYDKERVLQQMALRQEDAAHYIHPQRQYADLIVRFHGEGDYEEGNPTPEVAVKLAVHMHLDVELETLVDWMESHGVNLDHRYDADLQYQQLLLEEPPASPLVKEAAEALIPNLEEIVSGHRIQWEEGYHGFLQLLVLLMLSHLLKRSDDQ